MKNKTVVKKGQLWKDNDSRSPWRRLRVMGVYALAGGDVAHCQVEGTGRHVYVRTRRFRPGSRGYSLVKEK